MNAFPTLRHIEHPHGSFVTCESGMTLRDYFAAKAMQAMLSRRESITCPDEILAQDAYNTANAMLKARDNNG